MTAILRMILGVGLFSLGYYLGREVGRLESIREEMRRLRETVDQAGISGGPGSLPSKAENEDEGLENPR